MQRLKRGAIIWEIAIDGTTVVTTEGKATGPKKTDRRRFVTAEHARVHYDKVVAQKREEGFTSVEERLAKSAAKVARESADDVFLEPSDLDALAVHADALLSRGHFAGELLALFLELERLGPQPSDAARREELATMARAILRKKRPSIFGELGPFVESAVVGSRGKATPKGIACVATWRLGAIEEVRIEGARELDAANAIRALAHVPAARHLRSITVGLPTWVPPEGVRSFSYATTIQALIEEGQAFPRLTSLFLGNVPLAYTAASQIGDVSELLGSLPRLERLRLHGHVANLGAAVPIDVAELGLAGPCASVETLTALSLRKLTKLRALSLTPVHGHDSPVGMIPALEEADNIGLHEALRRFPSLTTLAVRNWGGNLVRPLVTLPQLASMREVDLSSNPPLYYQVDALVAVASALRHLEILDLRRSSILVDHLPRLQAALPNARLTPQTPDFVVVPPLVGRAVVERDDDDDRYDEIRE